MPAGPKARGFIYGRITTADDDSYEGRLRWGGDQEAYWNDYFDGVKEKNPWIEYAPQERPSEGDNPVEIFGFKLGGRRASIDSQRPFMTQFANIERIDAHLGSVQVTLKSGNVVMLNRFESGDIDDGVHVWDGENERAVDARQIRSIEFLSTRELDSTVPTRLHGTVRTDDGDFTGFIQWNRQDCLGTDELTGRTSDGERNVRFDTIRSIARHTADSAVVTLHDGRELTLSRSREVGQGNRGISIDDNRYGRVTISWNEFVRVDFTAADSGPAYEEFAPGQPLRGRVTTRAGRTLSGRLVYDFDESEDTDTLDVAFKGVGYSIPMALVASIVPAGQEQATPYAMVTLRGGDEIPLDPTGDLAQKHAGVLVFIDGSARPEYVPWSDVARIDLD